MTYVVIEDFRAGLDTRKMAESAPQGSLQQLINAHITRGGEIEKRKAWVPKYALPGGQTFGFAGANGTLYTFGSVAAPSVPAGVTYQRLQHSDGATAMEAVNDVEFFDGKTFVSATYQDATSFCFYDATRVTDWDTGSGATVAGLEAVSLLSVQSKVYAAALSLMTFSAIDDATDWKTGTGFGFVNMSNQAAGSETLTALARYQNKIAVFARRTTQIWFVDADPLQNAQQQVLERTGTLAPRSVVSFGDSDVFFLSDNGIRSLRVRQAVDRAGVSDVGTPIDDEVKAYARTLTPSVLQAAAATLEPVDGRYILAVGDRQYVFSYFEVSKISAWSRYDTGFTAEIFVEMDGQLWARAGDTIYLYGGDDGDTYDASAVTVELPYIDGRAVATWKQWSGLDVICEGEWAISINTDPKQPETWSEVAIVRGTTIAQLDIGMVGDSPILKIRAVNARAGAAKLSKLILHYTPNQAG